MVALPVTDKIMFHVEHSPVQKPSAPARAFLDEAMYFGIDDLYGKLQCELGQRCSLLPGYLGAHTHPAALNAERNVSLTGLYLAEYDEVLRTSFNEMIGMPRAK